MMPNPDRESSTTKVYPGSQDLAAVELVASPLRKLTTAFRGVLETLASQLIVPGQPSLTLQFVLHTLAEIAPSRIHPSTVVPKTDEYLGGDQDRANVIANQQASEQLLQEELDRDLNKFYALDPDPTHQPETDGWAQLFSNLATKWKYGILSPEERAAYESLSVFWYSTTCFTGAPRIVPLAAKLKLKVHDNPPESNSQSNDQDLANELRAYLLAPNDETVREILRRNDCRLGSLSKEEREKFKETWEQASIRTIEPDSCGSLNLLLKHYEASWPDPEKDTIQSRLACLHRRAVLAVQLCEISCLDSGFIDAMSTEHDLGALVNRHESWVSVFLNRSLPPKVMARRNSETLAHGHASGDASAARAERLVLFQRLLVEQYIDFRNTNNSNAFASDASLAAECGFSTERVQRYLRIIADVPWFREIATIRSRALEVSSRLPASGAGNELASTTKLSSMASGCRYRDEYFDSQSEAAVGILLEKYLHGYRIDRHRTYQVPVAGKKIDFRLGEYAGQIHYIEYHPIVLGRPGCRHDFRSDEDAYLYHARYTQADRNQQAKLFTATRQQLSKDYKESRAALVASLDEGAVLHHVKDVDQLYTVLKTMSGAEGLPSRPQFRIEFAKIIAALSALQYAEGLVEEYLQRECAERYNQDWRIASPVQISRPVRNQDAGKPSEIIAEPIITSFAHKSERRVVEFFVPYLFNSALQTGRTDDDLYRSEIALAEGLSARGYRALCLPASSVNEQTINEVGRRIVEFLVNDALETTASLTNDVAYSDVLFGSNWVDLF
jgi:hypothetical protein